MRYLPFLILIVVVTATAQAQPGGNPALGQALEVDAESGAEVYLLGGDERPADNIYGEQPYGDATGRRIAIRYYPLPDKPGGISILDLQDGARHEILSGKPPFPAFHAWGEWLYYAQTVEGKKLLRRCNYLTLQVEDVAELPPERGSYSYGTVSPDHRYYAVSVQPPDGRTLQGASAGPADEPMERAAGQTGLSRQARAVLARRPQPGADPTEPDAGREGGAAERAGDRRQRQRATERPFPADQPYTLRPTGHEAWIGTTSRIFFSTGADATTKGNIWSAKVGDEKPTLVYEGKRFGHVSVSRDGKYWIGDTGEKGVPIYIGSFATGRAQRACFSRTEYDNQQWSHAHPYLTADNQWLIFGARRNGHPQVYGAKLKDGWLEKL